MIESFKKLKKYNFWENKKINIGFERSVYLKKIKKYFGNNLIKVLVGQRRVGKSYLMRQIIHELIESGVSAKNIFYFNREIADFTNINDYKKLNSLIDFYKKELKVRGRVYVFLDDVQEIESWEKLVNSLFQDRQDRYEVFITGSNLRFLSSELASYLSGRYISFEVFSFSFAEYVDYLKIERSKKNFLNYLKSGGLPELFHLEGEEVKRHYIESLQNTILLKDIVSKYGIKNVNLLENIFKFSINNIGNLFSVNNVTGFLNSQKQKTNNETISYYLKYLKYTFLLHEVDRYDIRGKSILANTKKYYLNDLAFRNYLSSSFDYEPGNNLENIVYLYFRSLGYKVYVGKIGNNEIDFVVEKDGEKKYIQVCFSLNNKKTIEREFGNLEMIRDAYEKMVISLDDISFGNKDGIAHKLVWEI